MGITGLTKLLSDHCGWVIKENDIKNYFGRKIAIDASMAMYQFMIAVRGTGSDLTSEDGQVTSHVIGMFYRTIRMVENGIKPVFVFDGAPPELKMNEIAKRKEKAAEAVAELEKAVEAGDTESMLKMSKRSVRVSIEQTEQCKKLLRLMGIPIVEAPSEAEAQCASLVKNGHVWAVGTEDMDTLTFGSNVLVRHLTFSEARKMPILEIHLSEVLKGLELTHHEFIDLCILCGCDYSPTVKGIGPTTALKLIKEYKSIEAAIPEMQRKHQIPEDWNYAAAREFFRNPDVMENSAVELKWSPPDEEGLIQYLVKDLQFQEDRVRKGIARLNASRKQGTQVRLDQFFTVCPSQPAKRKEPTVSADSKKKKGPLPGKKAKK